MSKKPNSKEKKMHEILVALSKGEKPPTLRNDLIADLVQRGLAVVTEWHPSGRVKTVNITQYGKLHLKAVATRSRARDSKFKKFAKRFYTLLSKDCWGTIEPEWFDPSYYEDDGDEESEWSLSLLRSLREAAEYAGLL